MRIPHSTIISLVILLGLSALSAAPEDRNKVDMLIYGGKFSDTGLVNILTRQQTDYEDSFIAVGALNYQLDAELHPFEFETEGQIVQHFGIMRHLEFNGLLIVRWSRFIPGAPLNIALGEGLSLATKSPRLEERHEEGLFTGLRSQKTNPLLNYLMVEIEYPLKNAPYDPRLFLRIHHRSGVFGFYCPLVCGSNFISYGMKFKLEK